MAAPAHTVLCWWSYRYSRTQYPTKHKQPNNPEPPTTEAFCLAPFLFLLVAWKPEEYLDRKQIRVAVWLHPCQINVAGPSPQSMLLDLWILDLHFTDLVSSENWQQILVSKAVPWSAAVQHHVSFHQWDSFCLSVKWTEEISQNSQLPEFLWKNIISRLSLVIPATGSSSDKTLRFRPYLVKEESWTVPDIICIDCFIH